MAQSVLEILIKIKDEATQAVSRLTDDFKNADISLKQFATSAGIAAGALGAIGGITLSLAIKEAENAAITWLKVKTILKDTGVSFEELKTKAEEMATNSIFQAEDIGFAYAKNIGIFGNTDEALRKTKMAMDIAAYSGGDLADAQRLVSRASDENIRSLKLLGEAVGVHIGEVDGIINKELWFGQKLKEVTDKIKDFDNKVKETSALKDLQKQWNDFLQLIGNAILPVLNRLLKEYIIPLIQKLKDWTDQHPELFEKIVLVAGAIAGLLIVLTPFLLALPGLITLIKGLAIVIGLVLTPLGALIAGVAALIAFDIYYFIKNWKNIKEGFILILRDMKNYFVNIWNDIVKFFQEKIDWIIDKINFIKDKFSEVKEKVGGIVGGVGEKVSGAVGTVKGWLGFQEGGFVRSGAVLPAILHGPEAVIPLNKLAGAGIGGNIVINLSGTFYTEEEQAEKLANQIAKLIKYQLRI